MQTPGLDVRRQRKVRDNSAAEQAASSALGWSVNTAPTAPAVKPANTPTAVAANTPTATAVKPPPVTSALGGGNGSYDVWNKGASDPKKRGLYGSYSPFLGNPYLTKDDEALLAPSMAGMGGWQDGKGSYMRWSGGQPIQASQSLNSGIAQGLSDRYQARDRGLIQRGLQQPQYSNPAQMPGYRPYEAPKTDWEGAFADYLSGRVGSEGHRMFSKLVRDASPQQRKSQHGVAYWSRNKAAEDFLKQVVGFADPRYGIDRDYSQGKLGLDAQQNSILQQRGQADMDNQLAQQELQRQRLGFDQQLGWSKLGLDAQNAQSENTRFYANLGEAHNNNLATQGLNERRFIYDQNVGYGQLGLNNITAQNNQLNAQLNREQQNTQFYDKLNYGITNDTLNRNQKWQLSQANGATNGNTRGQIFMVPEYDEDGVKVKESPYLLYPNNQYAPIVPYSESDLDSSVPQFKDAR